MSFIEALADVDARVSPPAYCYGNQKSIEPKEICKEFRSRCTAVAEQYKVQSQSKCVNMKVGEREAGAAVSCST